MGVLKLEDIHYTYEDYQQWEGDWELYDGIPVSMAPAPVKRHQSLASAIIAQLYLQLEGCDACEVLGEVDYKIADDTVIRPDIVVICDEESEPYLLKTPELIVEIISPNTIRRDEIFKFELYEREKVPYYILIYPDKLYAKIYRHRGRRYEKAGDFMNETYTFEEARYPLTLDFSKIGRL